MFSLAELQGPITLLDATKGHPDGVMLPYYGGGDIRYYWLNLKRESEFPIPWGTWTKIFDDYQDLVD